MIDRSPQDQRPPASRNGSFTVAGKTWSAVGFAWELGYTIAIPVVVLTLAGRLLDKRLNTHPWFLLTGALLAMTITTVALVIKASRLLRSTDQSSDKADTKR